MDRLDVVWTVGRMVGGFELARRRPRRRLDGEGKIGKAVPGKVAKSRLQNIFLCPCNIGVPVGGCNGMCCSRSSSISGVTNDTT